MTPLDNATLLDAAPIAVCRRATTNSPLSASVEAVAKLHSTPMALTNPVETSKQLDGKVAFVTGASRNGFHWSRPDRRAFCPVSETPGTWNYANVQSAAGGCLVMGDRLYFYVSARGAGQVTGLATLRRNGFASVDADEAGGTLKTRLVTFKGRYPFVNVEAPQGELRAEILDEQDRAIAPFTKENCVPVKTDSTMAPLHWNGAGDLGALAGKNVRFQFHLRNGRLHSFWVSSDRSGASYGYVAAGGPGFTSNRDTAGRPNAYYAGAASWQNH